MIEYDECSTRWGFPFLKCFLSLGLTGLEVVKEDNSAIAVHHIKECRDLSTKIAVVTETFLPFRGGSAKRYFEVFKRLAKSGFEVDLYTARLKEEWAVKEEIDGIHIIRSPKVYGNFITKEGFRDVSQVLDFTLWTTKTLTKNGEYDLLEANHCPIFPAMASWF